MSAKDSLKDILRDTTRNVVPVFKHEYYNSIYKKTEKIVCAIFVITDTSKDREDIKDIISDTRHIAKESLLHIVDLVSLRVPPKLEEGVRALLRLRSMLYVLGAAQAVRSDLIEVVVREIDAVTGSVHSFYEESISKLSSEDSEDRPLYVDQSMRRVRRPMEVSEIRPRGVSSPVSLGSKNRREAILEIIRLRTVVSIKDISDSIKDCSEKTIQRELMDMIKDNTIIKEGERRWSRYRIY